MINLCHVAEFHFKRLQITGLGQLTLILHMDFYAFILVPEYISIVISNYLFSFYIIYNFL